MSLRINKDVVNFDPYNAQTLTSVETAWLERLFTDDWTMDPSVWSYQLLFRPTEYTKGFLAQTWEFSDPNTLVVHLRKGIHWQNIAPVQGREFIADDVVFHYNRLLGLGSGYTKPAPYYATVVAWQSLKSVTTTDKYTVAFNWNVPNPEFILETLRGPSTGQDIEAPEVVKQYGDASDWHHAVGTGSFILQDFVSSGSATLVKNPNYWGYDERYPKNQLPYIDTLKVIIIPDDATALAGLRSGKIDFMDQMSFQQSNSIQKTNPEILQLPILPQQALTIDPRNDVAPFKDIRVRQAMQMAIDLRTIAKTYYAGTVSSAPSTLTSAYMTGWGFPFTQWPQDLKDQYTYNPTQAKKLLAEAGYPTGFKTDIVADIAGDMDLLQVVKAYFLAVGVDMEIRTMDSASWVTFVQTGHKNDALAQRGVSGQLGNTYEPPRQLNRFQTGYSVNWCMISDPVYDAFYPKAMASTSVDAMKQVVKDANEYVARQHFSISLLLPSLFAFYQPWFKGYYGQSAAISGTAGSPQLISFYASRFWIDSTLKKSMGK